MRVLIYNLEHSSSIFKNNMPKNENAIDFLLKKVESFLSIYAPNTFEYNFHFKMQNPNDGKVIFNSIPRSKLHNGLLFSLSDYFDSLGKYFFTNKFTQLTISNTRLSRYNHSLSDQMPSATNHIAKLIEKNPTIKILDLSNTQLTDDDAKILIKALKTNNRLLKLELIGSNITQPLLDEINKFLLTNQARSQDKKEIKKASGIIFQEAKLQNSFFSRLPKEINLKIAASVRETLSDVEAQQIAIKYYCESK